MHLEILEEHFESVQKVIDMFNVHFGHTLIHHQMPYLLPECFENTVKHQK